MKKKKEPEGKLAWKRSLSNSFLFLSLFSLFEFHFLFVLSMMFFLPFSLLLLASFLFVALMMKRREKEKEGEQGGFFERKDLPLEQNKKEKKEKEINSTLTFVPSG